MIRSALKRNIPLDYLFTFSGNLNLTHGIWMIFLAARGFSLLEIGILESIFHITSFLMEVPMGVVADLRGRKASRLAGRFFFLASLGFMFLGRTFGVQAAGFILCALGYNLESGAGDALVYDSLKALGEEGRFLKIKGRQEFLFQTANIVSFLAGGFLAVRNYGFSFGGSAAGALLALGVGMLFLEPPRRAEGGSAELPEAGEAETGSGATASGEVSGKSLPARIAGSVKEQTLGSLGVLRREPRIALLILFSEFIFVFYVTVFFYCQNYWTGQGLSEWDIGIIYSLQCAVSGITGLLAHRAERRLGIRGLLLGAPLLMAAGLWGIALTPWSGLFFIAGGFVEGLLIVAVSDYINKLIPSEYRATILSFQSMCFSMGMIVLFPLIGWISQTWSLAAGLTAAAALATFAALLFFIRIRRRA